MTSGSEKDIKAQFRVLPVSPVVQEYNYDCGKAAIKTLLITFGMNIDEEELQRTLRTNRVIGTHPNRILETLEALNLELIEKVKAKMSDLEEMLSRGYYCLLVYQAWGTEVEKRTLESGHYSLAYGIDEDNIHLADPAVREEDNLGMGEGLRMVSRSDFEKDWCDQDFNGNIYDHWMLAVKPKDESMVLE